MRNYQLVLVLKTSLSEANRKKLLETIKGFLKGAKFEKEEEWGEKNLAYIIKKQDKGFYLNYNLSLEGELGKDFDRKLIAHDDVLRYLLLRK